MATKREIKFRAWDKDKMMYYPNWSTLSQKQVLVFEELPHEWVDDSDYDEEVILMQFTGLKDKNNKDIYEGDVINGANYNGSYCYGEVVFHNGQFVAWPIPKFTEGQNEFAYILNQIDVIGNIYENIELLK